MEALSTKNKQARRRETLEILKPGSTVLYKSCKFGGTIYKIVKLVKYALPHVWIERDDGIKRVDCRNLMPKE